ncbi:hypothetical protein ACFL1R_13450 [Candidatus Latescibacterota bacterium]
MKHLILILLTITTLTFQVFAQPEPDWVKNNGISAQYPERLFVTGLGIGEDNSLANRRELAEQNARTVLSSKFIVKIQGELLSIEKEVSGRYDSEFRNTVSSQTQLSLINVDVLHWDNARHKRNYALAVMNIETAIRNYSSRFDEVLKQIDSLIQSAEMAEKNNNMKEAITQYRKTFPLFIEVGETGTILQLLQGKSAFASSVETNTSFSITHTEIESKINELIQEKIETISNAAVSIAEQLHSQLNKSEQLALFPVTYRDTDFSSYFSAYFLSILEKELVPYFQIISRDIAGSHAKYPQNILTGTYWVEGETIHLLTYITNVQNGSKLAAASVKFPKEVAEKESVELLPRNFQQAMEDTKVFLKQDIIPGTLSLEVWTSKGNKNLMFKENEETEIFVRVNKPCYLQFIYHMANSIRLMLYNNLYVDISKVNQVFTLPDKFYFAPPLGVERLQVFANTENFEDAKTVSSTYNGERYDNVLAENFKQYTSTMRGIKKKHPVKEITEKIVTITTIP